MSDIVGRMSAIGGIADVTADVFGDLCSAQLIVTSAAVDRQRYAGDEICFVEPGEAPALARRLGEVLANPKAQAVAVLLSESNEIHVADLLARVYRIERGIVTRA